jgi:hypothetical protein
MAPSFARQGGCWHQYRLLRAVDEFWQQPKYQIEFHAKSDMEDPATFEQASDLRLEAHEGCVSFHRPARGADVHQPTFSSRWRYIFRRTGLIIQRGPKLDEIAASCRCWSWY